MNVTSLQNTAMHFGVCRVQQNESESPVVYRGVLNFELGTDVWPEVSTTTL